MVKQVQQKHASTTVTNAWHHTNVSLELLKEEQTQALSPTTHALDNLWTEKPRQVISAKFPTRRFLFPTRRKSLYFNVDDAVHGAKLLEAKYTSNFLFLKVASHSHSTTELAGKLKYCLIGQVVRVNLFVSYWRYCSIMDSRSVFFSWRTTSC